MRGPVRNEHRGSAAELIVSGTKMRLQREGSRSIEKPTEAEIRHALSLTKSSFASLTADDGSYVQVAGGPGLFALEFHDASGRHFRGRQAQPKVKFPDGTTLSFSGGTLTLAQREWFLIDQVTKVLVAFSSGQGAPSFVEWQPLNEQFTYAR